MLLSALFAVGAEELPRALHLRVGDDLRAALLHDEPSSMKMTRSETSRAKLISWVTIIIVVCFSPENV